MKIEIKGTSEALDQRNRASAGRLARKSRLLDPVRSDATVDDAEHLTHHCRAVREQELDNLIGNAIEHTPANGRVELSLDTHDDSSVAVAVAVTDTGPGIDKQDLRKVFEPFYRSGNRFDEQGHAGLGLAISRRIVELQGGKLRAANRAEQGSVFTFALPAR